VPAAPDTTATAVECVVELMGGKVLATWMVDQQLDAGPQQSRFCARWLILHKPEGRKKIPALYFRDLRAIDTSHLVDGGRHSCLGMRNCAKMGR
jgi:hypothetical protein